jgi:anti-sigma-K factor RskA
MPNTPEPRLAHEDRDRTIKGFLQRVFFRYAIMTALSIAVLVGGATWSMVTGMAQAPANYRALRVDLTTVDSTLKMLVKADSSTRRVSALDVSFQCLDADSTLLAASWRTCAEALVIARVDPEFWQPRIQVIKSRLGLP